MSLVDRLIMQSRTHHQSQQISIKISNATAASRKTTTQAKPPSRPTTSFPTPYLPYPAPSLPEHLFVVLGSTSEGKFTPLNDDDDDDGRRPPAREGEVDRWKLTQLNKRTSG